MSAKNQHKRARGQKQDLIQPINSGSILSNSNHDRHLVGNAPTAGYFYDSLLSIASFLRQHQFLSAGSSTGASASVSTESYGQLIKDFEISQLNCQPAGLRTNTNSASASDVQKITDCHSDALEHGLNCIAAKDSWLDKTNLQFIHAKLCPDQAEAGRYRDNKVRASNTLFVIPENIETEMNNFFFAAKRFQTMWANPSTAIMDEQQWVKLVHGKISIVAIILFGIVDIHPFRDGNGRTARVFMNIALKRILGLPFPITITSQVHHRRQYVDAIKECRSRLSHISKGEDMAEGQSAFDHLTKFVADRVLHAVVQMNSLVELKAHSAAMEEEARVARRVREKLSAGQCIICLDEHPNISTLCCGQAIHHNCLTEWLSNQGSCIACRKAMPKIPQTLQRQQVPPTNVNASTDRAEETTEDSTTEDTTDDDVVQQQQDNNDTTEDSTTEDTTDDDVVQQQHDNNDTTEDSTTEDTTDDTNTEDTSDDTEPADNAPVQSNFCCHCRRNKFAVDCSNSMCGRCCQVYGQLGCSRHYC
eukprot:scaffold2258_cov144-Skeletonema_menzelii.AAC.16